MSSSKLSVVLKMASKLKFTDEMKEYLIYQVQERPFLYDHSDKRHRNTMQCEMAWEAISDQMNRELSVCTTGDAVKKAWRILRDQYNRARRRCGQTKSVECKEEDLGQEKKAWKFCEFLGFLDPYLDDPRAQKPSYITLEVDGLDSNEGEVEPTVLQDGVDDEGLAHLSSASPSPERNVSELKLLPSHSAERRLHQRNVLKAQSSYRQRLKRTGDDADLETERKLGRNVIPSRRAATEGIGRTKSPLDLFLESASIRIERLPPMEQSFVQLQISQILINAENRHMPSIPITPLPRLEPTEGGEIQSTVSATDNVQASHSTLPAGRRGQGRPFFER